MVGVGNQTQTNAKKPVENKKVSKTTILAFSKIYHHEANICIDGYRDMPCHGRWCVMR